MRCSTLLVLGVLSAVFCGCHEAPRLIAHAGGEVDGVMVTNSLEALDGNYRRGHRYFELDLTFTFDWKLDLIHDWSETYRRLFETPTAGLPTLAQFEALTMNSGLHQLTLTGLLDWLERNPDAYIVTDAKSHNVETLQRIRDRFQDYRTRFIPQIYSIDEFRPVHEMGYQRIILTLYLTDASNADILSFAQTNDVFAITMTPQRGAYGDLAIKLKERGQVVYFYTVNSAAEADRLTALGAYGFYTDALTY